MGDRLPPSQWRSARTTNAIERLHEEFKRRIKTQTVLPSADTAAMLFWALLASGDGTECVAKLFWASERERMIQDWQSRRNIDSNAQPPRFICFRIQFHRSFSATFATQSAKNGLMRCNKGRGDSTAAFLVGFPPRPSFSYDNSRTRR